MVGVVEASKKSSQGRQLLSYDYVMRIQKRDDVRWTSKSGVEGVEAEATMEGRVAEDVRKETF